MGWRPSTDFGRRVRAAREQAGLSQQELARLVGITQPSVQAIESGRAKGTKHVVAIAQAVGCSPQWLALGDCAEDVPAPFAAERAANADVGAVVTVKGSDYACIGVYNTWRPEPRPLPLDHHLMSLRSLRALSGVPAAQIAGFQLTGDAMSPTIGATDWLFADVRQHELGAPGIYVVEVPGGIGAYRFSGNVDDGPTTLTCDNPKYAPLIVADPRRLRFIGKALFTVTKC